MARFSGRDQHHFRSGLVEPEGKGSDLHRWFLFQFPRARKRFRSFEMEALHEEIETVQPVPEKDRCRCGRPPAASR